MKTIEDIFAEVQAADNTAAIKLVTNDLPQFAALPDAGRIELFAILDAKGVGAAAQQELRQVLTSARRRTTNRAGDTIPPQTQEPRIWSANEILATEFPEPKWLIEDVLPPGLGGMGSRPKLGKSWLALQMATAVSLGTPLWDRQTRQVNTLYMSLEDNILAGGIKDRLKAQRAEGNMQLDFVDEWQPITQVEAFLRLADLIERNGYGFVVVDTITRVIGRADVMNQGEMAEIFGRLHTLAKMKEITILLIDHHRKGVDPKAGDAIDDFMGATSKAGILDFAMGLYRQRGERAATLRIDGRVIRDSALSLTWDPELACWQYAGDARSVVAESVQGEILAALAEMGGKSTTQRIAKYIERHKGTVSKELAELITKHKVRKAARKGREVLYLLVDDGNDQNDGDDDDDE